MGTSTNGPRGVRTSRRAHVSFMSFLLLFALTLGQSGSLMALADDDGTDPAATEEAVSDGVPADEPLPVEATPTEAPAEEAPAEEAPAEEAPAEEATAEEAPAAEEGIADSSANRDAAIAAPAALPGGGGLDGGDIDLDFVAAGPLTYDHATGLGAYPLYGFNDGHISKNDGVVESLEGGDFECGDLVAFFTEVTVNGSAGGQGDIELDYSFGAETTGQPGIGFDDIVSVGLNAPDDGNHSLDGDEAVALVSETPDPAGDQAGYDQVLGTVRVTNLDPGDVLIVRLIVHLACEIGDPTGNLLNAIERARVIEPATDTISVGQQTVPMKQVGDVAQPGVNIVKTCPVTSPFGDDLIYDIRISNGGNETLVNIVVTDTVNGNPPVDISNLFPDTLATGASFTAQYSYSPDGTEPDPLPNRATITATGAISESSVTDTSGCETDITHAPGIDVTKSCPRSAGVGDVITYTITITNTGNEPLESITVNDSILGDVSSEFPDTLAIDGSFTAFIGYTVTAQSPDPIHNVVTASGFGADSEVEATDEAFCDTDIENPAIQIVKDGPAIVHRGDTITYEFEVTNTGDVELFDVALTDPICDAGTVVPGADVDASLAVGEVWHFTCTHLVTGEDPDPIPNTGTVRGDTDEGEGGREVTDSDDHVVDIIHPGIAIEKTVDQDNVPVGTTVTFTYLVTNTGDTTLYGISVDDDILGHIGDIEVLEPGQSVTLTKDFVVGDEPVTNVGTAEGEDILGRSVSADDDAIVTPILGGGGGNPPPNNPPTPFTGSDAGRLGLIIMVLFGIGVTVVASTRRRRPEHEAA